jgi:branched-chain amino acid transport system permease protein
MMRPDFHRFLRSPWLWGPAVLAFALPSLLSTYHLAILTLALIYVTLALAWNIVGGIAGQISLGHSVFIGCGAILASSLTVQLGWNMWAGLALSAGVAAALGVFMAFLDSRFRLGHLSFALVTLAFAEIGELVVSGSDFLGGASGMDLPKDLGRLSHFEFGGSAGYFRAALVLAVASVILTQAILSSRLGYALRALRDNEDAAQAIGIELFRNKAIAMAISAALSAVGGTLYARYGNFVDPSLLASPNLTIEIVLIATIGGLGTPAGPLLAALVLVPAGELLRGWLGSALPGLHFFLYGLIIIVVVLTSPQGVVPRLAGLRARFTAR